MRVRSLNSRVHKWADAAAVDEAARRWAGEAAARRPDVLRIGYFGSYARGDWGVGSDLDLLVIVDRSGKPFERRSAEWDAAGIPVAVDVVVYTRAEWDGAEGTRFRATVDREAVWCFVRAGAP